MRLLGVLLAALLLMGCTEHTSKKVMEASPIDEILTVRPNEITPVGGLVYVKTEVKLGTRDLGGMIWEAPSEYAGLLQFGRVYRLEPFTTPPALGLVVEVKEKYPCGHLCDPLYEPWIVRGTGVAYTVPPPKEVGNMKFRVTIEVADRLIVGERYLFMQESDAS